MRHKLFLILFCFCLVLYGCKSGNDTENQSLDSTAVSTGIDSHSNKEQNIADSNFNSKDTIKATEVFSNQGFDSTIYYKLLIETRLCNPKFTDTTKDGTCPCSARYFRFFPYNHNRRIQDAFLLQVRAGVNGYPYRRLLIFIRENGKLVLMNGIVGYLFKRIPQKNGIDDLVVGVIDDLGHNNFSRYDVLLRYKDGKYHFIEALGDLQGQFDNDTLKERATKAIKKRIEEKQLIF